MQLLKQRLLNIRSNMKKNNVKLKLMKNTELY
ncbi:hypothetical protein N184_32765 [Sinorhizobium sp. GL28]|nr:hypothetical protein N184_32765 [Sinorhizobium sp. GL28]